MIKVKFNADKHEITIKGHSMLAPKGEDLICAGVSTLVGALAYTLDDNKQILEDLVTNLTDGDAVLSCIPKKGYERNVALLYLPILTGFSLLANKYPKNITFKSVCGVRKKKN